ncbi:centromere/kinetochore protein zw10 homolog isoform X2 [Macrosteles quadrilineatus]|uniref:centromere/kinetochore protein zw10 homolog isoform X2 n=1 Tax=Macrosteles quadrilineatus TaxID=74068 RepID=UPI0023E303E3|nr:centromere/kinetochore protein zw10 homolog isoform X2 [Macrosteles quadrilineatus]XP_054258008.1 centromere/kinetochore protein zw10 homolog isoform X2 [Macrosteles quadrilineatus]XP_054258009.1 centromere/kinetochore protein zw10 homolog isoform X2 [Macrosteles quadrilineatus]
MSFLAEILASQGEADMKELNGKIQEINKQIFLLKEEVTLTMEDIYINYTCALVDTNHMLNKTKNLVGKINDVKERIDDQLKKEIESSKEELESLTRSLKESIITYELINNLLNIHLVFEASQDVKNNSKFLEIAQQLKAVEEDLKNDRLGIENMEIFESLQSELQFHQRKHSYNTVKLWSQCFVWSESLIENYHKTVKLSLNSNIDNEQLFKALYYYELLSFEMSEFSEKLFKDVLCPVVSNVAQVDIEGNTGLLVKIGLQGKKPACIDVLNNLTIVFNFLNLYLNFKANQEVSFISELKKHISDDFCNFFIKNCLSLTVPKRRDELQSYKALVEEITAFELLLKDVGFIEEDNKVIAEYATNIEELFAKKTCETFLAAARNIMKKDLHDIKEVGTAKGNVPTNLSVSTHLNTLSLYTFQFPHCQISKSTDELLALVEEVLAEVIHNTDMCAAQLFYTARNIFSLYCDIVPTFHSRLLDSIPQQSAILHNNAMYLAHQLMYLGQNHLPQIHKLLRAHTITFVDLVEPMRGLAAETLSRQLIKQRTNITNILRDSGLVTLSDSTKFPEGIEKAIRMCLRQLALLQTVWQHVLPANTYCKALGLLCNAFVEELISKVVALEDISADTATQLVVIFNLVQQKAPNVFPEPLEIHRHVKKWSKFCELQLVLGASLRDVDERWADGKGPLAQEFTADQVRHLVRALFQISDRRAVLLAKIV